jgi:hypothetical protein
LAPELAPDGKGSAGFSGDEDFNFGRQVVEN